MKKDNVIRFPTTHKLQGKSADIVTVDDVETTNAESMNFAYEIVDVIHELLQEKTGDCVYTDDEYTPIIILVAEVLSAIYLTSQGVDDHPMQNVAADLFGDVDIDN